MALAPVKSATTNELRDIMYFPIGKLLILVGEFPALPFFVTGNVMEFFQPSQILTFFIGSKRERVQVVRRNNRSLYEIFKFAIDFGGHPL